MVGLRSGRMEGFDWKLTGGKLVSLERRVDCRTWIFETEEVVKMEGRKRRLLPYSGDLN